MLDGLALSILEGVIRAGEAVAHNPGVQRPTRMDVFLTEVGVPVRVTRGWLLDIRRSGSLARRLWAFRFVARNQGADAEKDQRRSRRCRNSRLHKCLRLPEWHDQDPAQVNSARALYLTDDPIVLNFVSGFHLVRVRE